MSLKIWQRYTIAFLYLILITGLFFLPGSALPKNDFLSKIWFDKWVHIGLFLFLVVLFSWAANLLNNQHLIWVLFAAAVYGMIIEICQDKLVANREFDIGDWIADLLGALIGGWLWLYISRRYKKSKPL
jgi:VanZ family protein